MSDINKKSYYSKLRNNEMSKCDSQSKSNYYYQTFGSQMVDLESSNVPKKNTDQQREDIAEPNRLKCGGRGMAIRQLCESMKSTQLRPRSLGLDFSNISIERHFRKLREESLKKLEAENKKEFDEHIHSNEES